MPKKPATKKPATKKTATKKTATKKTAAKKAATKKPAAKLSARERGVTVEDYVGGLPAERREVVQRLSALVRKIVPAATASIKWGQPVFEHHGPLIWMKSTASHVGFGFWRGAELPDPVGVLEGTGDRMRHVKIRSATDIDDKVLGALIRAAAKLNSVHGDPTRRP